MHAFLGDCHSDRVLFDCDDLLDKTEIVLFHAGWSEYMVHAAGLCVQLFGCTSGARIPGGHHLFGRRFCIQLEMRGRQHTWQFVRIEKSIDVWAMRTFLGVTHHKIDAKPSTDGHRWHGTAIIRSTDSIANHSRHGLGRWQSNGCA